MKISTQHLLPKVVPQPSPEQQVPVMSVFPVMDSDIDEGYGRPVFSVAPQTAVENGTEPQLGTFSGRTESKFISLDPSDFENGNVNHNNTVGLETESQVESLLPTATATAATSRTSVEADVNRSAEKQEVMQQPDSGITGAPLSLPFRGTGRRIFE